MTPVNLSQSGAATEAAAVQDSNGVLHVLWKDDVTGFVYSRTEAEGWRAPAPVDVPFVAVPETGAQTTEEELELFMPQLYADRNGRIHALWTNEEAELLYSSVAADAFANADAWIEVQSLAPGVLATAVAVDSGNGLHLSYIQSEDAEEQPAGLYYRRLEADSPTWTDATSLFQSAYFRSLPPENARVHVATTTIAEVGRVYVVWDHPARERVFISQSNDNGQSWLEPREVDRREAEDSETAVGPSKILVATTASEVHLIWQAGHEGAECTQYHQWSVDGGDSWEAPRPMLTELAVCPNTNSFVVAQDGRLLLSATVDGGFQDGVYLLTWNGTQWSKPQQQELLSEFLNPDTLRPVSFSCRQAFSAADQLIVVGCSDGDIRDIWLLQRPLGDLVDWFPAPSIWQAAPVLATTSTEISSTLAVPDADGWIHVLWTELNSGIINYLRWDGVRWSRSLPILTSPSGRADQPVATVTPDGRLFVIWSDKQSGQLFFSQTNSARALFPEDWIAPQQVAIPHAGASSPDILLDSDGVIYVSYAIPINEERGIYVTRSDDLGQTWSEPVKAFDGVAAGWAMVDRPKLAWTERNQLHLLWTRYSTPPGAAPRVLAYARSTDGGESWSEPEIVASAELRWHEIASAGEGMIQRFWQEVGENRTTLWHETSVDGGATWTLRALITSTNTTEPVPVALTQDVTGQLHLIQREGSLLVHRLWNGSNWVEDESLIVSRTNLDQVNALALTVTSDDRLAALYTGSQVTDTGETYSLQLANRPLDLPERVEAADSSLISTPQPSPTVTLEPTPIPSATPRASFLRNEDRERESRILSGAGPELILGIAIAPAGLLVLVVLTLSWKRRRR